MGVANAAWYSFKTQVTYACVRTLQLSAQKRGSRTLSLPARRYSHHNDREIGVAVIDRFTYYSLQYLEALSGSSGVTVRHAPSLHETAGRTLGRRHFITLHRLGDSV